MQAKSHNGNWLVRIDDLDPPREVEGAASSILHTLDYFGLHWDGEVVYQSHRTELYESALAQLNKQNLLYQCTCSRKQIKQTATQGVIGYVYPGTCLNKINLNPYDKINPVITRVKMQNSTICFNDALQGEITQNLATQVGDVILKRSDGLLAYHLAVVVDDYHQNITQIVRGIDLLDCTAIQIYLHNRLYCTNDKTCFQTEYLHLPNLVDQHHKKLSKQTKAEAVNLTNIEGTLFTLLNLLKQNPPTALKFESKDNILKWAIEHWDINQLRGENSIMITTPSTDYHKI